MISRKRWWSAGALAILVAGVGGVPSARAQQAPDAANPCTPRQGLMTPEDREAIGRVMFNRVKEKLGLADQQAEEIRAALQAMRDAARADFQAICEARVELRRLLDEQTSDPAAVKAAGERVNALQAKLMDRRLDGTLALRSKLTADQWAKWVELRKERGRRFRGRFGGFAS